MKQWQKCPGCGAVYDLTGCTIDVRLIPLPVHAKGMWPDPSELGSMLFIESLNDPRACDCSELLAHVHTEESDHE